LVLLGVRPEAATEAALVLRDVAATLADGERIEPGDQVAAPDGRTLTAVRFDPAASAGRPGGGPAAGGGAGPGRGGPAGGGGAETGGGGNGRAVPGDSPKGGLWEGPLWIDGRPGRSHPVRSVSRLVPPRTLRWGYTGAHGIARSSGWSARSSAVWPPRQGAVR